MSFDDADDVAVVDLSTIDIGQGVLETLDEADVTIRQNDYGLYIADHEPTGVSSQGPAAEEALVNLAAAVDNYREATSDDPGDDWL